jgi:hypothetical protein
MASISMSKPLRSTGIVVRTGGASPPMYWR